MPASSSTSPVPLDLHKSLGKRGEGAAKSKVEDRFLTQRIEGIPREGEGQGLAVLRRVEEARKVVPPSHRTSRGRGIYGGPMVVEFLVLFMGRCTADDRLEICLFRNGLHLVDS